MILHHSTFGEGEAIVILHGLFGMSDNWKTMARLLSTDYQVVTMDLRNHGRSNRSETMTYASMAGDVVETLESLNLQDIHLIGHSMGGKVAMKFADHHPDVLNSLIVLDILPRAYPPKHKKVFKAIHNLHPKPDEGRAEILERLIAMLDGDLATSNFLSKNLKRTSDGYEWKFNISAIEKSYTEIGSQIKLVEPYEGRCLFIGGGDSNYIDRDGWVDTLDDFPNAELLFIEGAGHWLHAQKPEETLKAVDNFIRL